MILPLISMVPFLSCCAKFFPLGVCKIVAGEREILTGECRDLDDELLFLLVFNVVGVLSSGFKSIVSNLDLVFKTAESCTIRRGAAGDLVE